VASSRVGPPSTRTANRSGPYRGLLPSHDRRTSRSNETVAWSCGARPFSDSRIDCRTRVRAEGSTLGPPNSPRNRRPPRGDSTFVMTWGGEVPVLGGFVRLADTTGDDDHPGNVVPGFASKVSA